MRKYVVHYCHMEKGSVVNVVSGTKTPLERIQMKCSNPCCDGSHEQREVDDPTPLADMTLGEYGFIHAGSLIMQIVDGRLSVRSVRPIEYVWVYPTNEQPMPMGSGLFVRIGPSGTEFSPFRGGPWITE